MVNWYFPWHLIDWVLRLQLIVWLSMVVLSYWIFWRTVVKKHGWLRKRSGKKP
jgi:membrane protein implicated in regulation of membrane protease activity